MKVLNWVQARLQGTRKPEPAAASSRRAHTSGDLHRDDGLEGWAAAMLSIGTFGVTDGDVPKSTDELDRLQDELRLLVRAKRVAGVEDDEGSRRHHRLISKRSLSRTSSSTNGAEVVQLKQRSFRKLVAGAFSGFLPKSSFRETMPEPSVPEILRSLLHKRTHPEKSALPKPIINGDQTVQRPQKGTAGGEDQEGSKWIRTDSEYIVLEI